MCLASRSLHPRNVVKLLSSRMSHCFCGRVLILPVYSRSIIFSPEWCSRNASTWILPIASR
jgi:hypothetical protein